MAACPTAARSKVKDIKKTTQLWLRECEERCNLKATIVRRIRMKGGGVGSSSNFEHGRPSGALPHATN
jgi:hypothetical protein